jgi:hypothetical protein
VDTVDTSHLQRLSDLTRKIQPKLTKIKAVQENDLHCWFGIRLAFTQSVEVTRWWVVYETLPEDLFHWKNAHRTQQKK